MICEQAQWIFILEHYLKTQSYASVQETFEEHFSVVVLPTKRVISRLVTKFRDAGSCANQSRVLSPIVITTDNIECVKNVLR